MFRSMSSALDVAEPVIRAEYQRLCGVFGLSPIRYGGARTALGAQPGMAPGGSLVRQSCRSTPTHWKNSSINEGLTS